MSSLPAVMVEMAEAAGAEAAWAVVQAHGGTTVYFPRAAKKGHWLTELVGMDAAKKLCRHFRLGNSGARVLIPLCRNGQQRQRLIRALADGMSAPEAARVAGMHERSAYRNRAAMKSKKVRRKKPDASQQDLF